MANFIEVPTQSVVGHKEVTTLPVPVTRWHALKRDIRLTVNAPWLFHLLASVCLGVCASAALALFTTNTDDRQRIILVGWLGGSGIASLALFAAAHQQRKVKSQQVTSIIDMMDAIEESYDVPPCPHALDPSLGYRFRAAFAAFKSPP